MDAPSDGGQGHGAITLLLAWTPATQNVPDAGTSPGETIGRFSSAATTPTMVFVEVWPWPLWSNAKNVPPMARILLIDFISALSFAPVPERGTPARLF